MNQSSNGGKKKQQNKNICDPNYGCIKLQSVLSDKKELCNTIRKIEQYVLEQYSCMHGIEHEIINKEVPFIITKIVQSVLLTIIGLLTELEFTVPYNHHSNGGNLYYSNEVKKLLENEKLNRIIEKKGNKKC